MPRLIAAAKALLKRSLRRIAGPSAAGKAAPEPPRVPKRKVFVVGFSKTGTKSTGAAIAMLGYRRESWNGTTDRLVSNWHEGRLTERMQTILRDHDTFDDWPWALMFRELDALYPDALFVMTTRSDEGAWLRSLRSHFKRTGNLVAHFLVYGSYDLENEPDRFLERYRQHNRDVLSHFEGRPDKLLVMDVEQGDGWEVLCTFLGEPVPAEPFPHRNSDPARAAKML
jgi:hypothetical protein